jgi:hypothetical protein
MLFAWESDSLTQHPRVSCPAVRNACEEPQVLICGRGLQLQVAAQGPPELPLNMNNCGATIAGTVEVTGGLSELSRLIGEPSLQYQGSRWQR